MKWLLTIISCGVLVSMLSIKVTIWLEKFTTLVCLERHDSFTIEPPI